MRGGEMLAMSNKKLNIAGYLVDSFPSTEGRLKFIDVCGL